MSKITLEITEVVNGVSITETPITLQGDLLAAASTTATGVAFTPTGGIGATNVQTALAELDTEKMPLAGGTFTGDVIFDGASQDMRWDTSANQLKFNDGVKAVFGAANSLEDADLEIFHVSNQSYIRDTGAGTLFIQTDGPGITLGGTINNNVVSGTFIPGAEVTLYHNSNAKITTTANGVDVVGSIKTTTGVVFDDAGATGTASANTLDAYEEGTWTPVVRDATTGGNAATLQAATGHYTLIGNQCTLVARFINIDPDAGSPSAPTGGNTIHITGLPFSPANLPTGIRHIGSMESTNMTYQNSIQPRILENANYIVISNSQNDGSLSTLDFDALNSSAADIFLQVTYTV